MQSDEALTLLDAGFRRLKGIGLYGLLRDAEHRGDTATLTALARWYDWQIGRLLPPRQVNSTAPMLALACLAQQLGRDDWRALCADWAG